jgi:type I restriction enzyme S subunit
MSKEKLIPDLRFPEFINEGEWKDKFLSEICKITNGKANVQDHLEEGQYPLFDRSEVIKASNEFIFDCETVIIPGEGMRFIPKYYEGKFNLHQRAYALKDFSCSGRFVFYSILHRSDLLSQKAMQSTVLSLRLPILQNFPIEVPQNPQEQQKITSCLSSLDEVIAAHSQKLEILKVYKRGLMQNLFPSTGEKVPNLRFKEFEKDGEWMEKKLGTIGDPLMCKRILKEQTTNKSKDGIPFYKIGTFGREADAYIPIELYKVFINKYSFPNVGDILISASGTIGRLVVYDGFPAYFQDSNIVWLGNNEELVLNAFLYHFYSILKWQTSDGGIISRLYNSDLKNIGIKFPKGKAEQQKIASCLSILDNLIKAQSEKIEQLKLHKKGLMQGLFPKILD